MDDTKFTPGPWHITNESGFMHPDIDKMWVDPEPGLNPTSNGDGFWSIAELSGPDAKANARLIAAAPELYAAVCYVRDNCDMDSVLQTLIDKALAAAEGK